jgi:hypothetical protein
LSDAKYLIFEIVHKYFRLSKEGSQRAKAGVVENNLECSSLACFQAYLMGLSKLWSLSKRQESLTEGESSVRLTSLYKLV